MTSPRPSLRRVEHHMGTAVTLGVRGVSDEVADRFFDRIRTLELLLSRFRSDSEISRVAEGSLGLDATDPAVREVLTRCEDLRTRTRGCFNHEPHKQTGDASHPRLDPSAFAKGWILEEASTVLHVAGASEFLINAGGDVIVNRPGHAKPWRVGIQHPSDPAALVAVLEGTALAIATSGTYQRGQHIRSMVASQLSSVTVVGPDLAGADGLATAVYAAGSDAPTWWDRFRAEYGLLTLSVDNQLRWTPPMDQSSGNPQLTLCRHSG